MFCNLMILLIAWLSHWLYLFVVFLCNQLLRWANFKESQSGTLRVPMQCKHSDASLTLPIGQCVLQRFLKKARQKLLNDPPPVPQGGARLMTVCKFQPSL